MRGARFSSRMCRALRGEQRRWTRNRILGFVAGVSLFVAVVSFLSPVDTDITMYWMTAHRIFEQEVDPYILQPGGRYGVPGGLGRREAHWC